MAQFALVVALDPYNYLNDGVLIRIQIHWMLIKKRITFPDNLNELFPT